MTFLTFLPSDYKCPPLQTFILVCYAKIHRPYSVCGSNKVNETCTSTDSITGFGTLLYPYWSMPTTVNASGKLGGGGI